MAECRKCIESVCRPEGWCQMMMRRYDKPVTAWSVLPVVVGDDTVEDFLRDVGSDALGVG